MGGQQSILYSVTVPGQEQPQNSTKVRRRPEFVDKLVESLDPELNTIQLILRRNFEKFGENECIGRVREI